MKRIPYIIVLYEVPLGTSPDETTEAYRELLECHDPVEPRKKAVAWSDSKTRPVNPAWD